MDARRGADGGRVHRLHRKHSGGFCNWPTRTTDYSVKSTPWRGGKGDMVREVASRAASGPEAGIYLSPATETRGPLDLGDGLEGSQGHCADPKQQPVYDEMYRRQLIELLTGYGEVMELWFDGGTVTPIADILRSMPRGP